MSLEKKWQTHKERALSPIHTHSHTRAGAPKTAAECRNLLTCIHNEQNAFLCCAIQCGAELKVETSREYMVRHAFAYAPTELTCTEMKKPWRKIKLRIQTEKHLAVSCARDAMRQNVCVSVCGGAAAVTVAFAVHFFHRRRQKIEKTRYISCIFSWLSRIFHLASRSSTKYTGRHTHTHTGILVLTYELRAPKLTLRFWCVCVSVSVCVRFLLGFYRPSFILHVLRP